MMDNFNTLEKFLFALSADLDIGSTGEQLEFAIEYAEEQGDEMGKALRAAYEATCNISVDEWEQLELHLRDRLED